MTASRIAAALALGLAATLAGCGSTPTRSTASADGAADTAADEKAVSERALARWNALISGKPAEAYEYLSPGVRSTIQRDKYIQNMTSRPVHWVSAKIYEASCEGDACQLTVELEYEVTVPAMGVGKVRAPAHVLEHWVRLKRDWYHVPEVNLKGES